MHRILFPATLILIAGCLGAGAKDLKILTGAGMSMPVRQMAQEFAARTGTKVDVVSDTAGGVQKRLWARRVYEGSSCLEGFVPRVSAFPRVVNRSLFHGARF